MVTTIGIRELQQRASMLVRNVEQGEVDYRITVQGRDTGVRLTKEKPVTVRCQTLANALTNQWWGQTISDEARQRLLDEIEAGRDAMGLVSE